MLQILIHYFCCINIFDFDYLKFDQGSDNQSGSAESNVEEEAESDREEGLSLI